MEGRDMVEKYETAVEVRLYDATIAFIMKQ